MPLLGDIGCIVKKEVRMKRWLTTMGALVALLIGSGLVPARTGVAVARAQETACSQVEVRVDVLLGTDSTLCVTAPTTVTVLGPAQLTFINHGTQPIRVQAPGAQAQDVETGAEVSFDTVLLTANVDLQLPPLPLP
jgi:hypothetical protein